MILFWLPFVLCAFTRNPYDRRLLALLTGLLWITVAAFGVLT